MGLNRGSSNVLDHTAPLRTPTPSSSPHILQRIAESSRTRLLSMFLVISAGASIAIPTPLGPVANVRADEVPPAPISSTDILKDVLLNYPEMDAVTINGNTFHCVFKRIPFTGSLNAAGHLTSLVWEGAMLRCSSPIEGSFVARVIHNAYQSRMHIPPTTQDRSLITDDGVRLMYTEEEAGEIQTLIALPTGLVKVISMSDPSTTTEWQAAARTYEQHRQHLRERLTQSFNNNDMAEWRLRQKMEWLERRFTALDAYMTLFIDRFREHPYKRIDWETAFVYWHDTIDPLRKACQVNPHTIGFIAYEARLAAMEKELASAEKRYQLSAGEDRKSVV